jgi:hypothetical protein
LFIENRGKMKAYRLYCSGNYKKAGHNQDKPYPLFHT